jgi:hypothetical protein
MPFLPFHLHSSFYLCRLFCVVGCSKISQPNAVQCQAMTIGSETENILNIKHFHGHTDQRDQNPSSIPKDEKSSGKDPRLLTTLSLEKAPIIQANSQYSQGEKKKKGK